MHLPAPAVHASVFVMLDRLIEESARAQDYATLRDLFVSVSARRAAILALLVQPPDQADRFLTVQQASELFPVSRTFLYEHGEELGLLCRPKGLRGPRCSERALREWLQRR